MGGGFGLVQLGFIWWRGLVQVGAGLELFQVEDGGCKDKKGAKVQTLEGIEAGNC